MGAVIALFLVLGALTACAGGPIAEMKQVLPAVETVRQEITYAVELEDHEGVIRDVDGAELVGYRYEVPVMRAFREDGSEILEAKSAVEEQALTTAEAFNARFTGWMAEDRLQDMAEYAAEERGWKEEDGIAWSSEMAYGETLDCTVYETERMVSVSAVCGTYTGGAHPNSVLLGWNFDLTSGSFFEPEALAADWKELSDLVDQELLAHPLDHRPALPRKWCAPLRTASMVTVTARHARVICRAVR